MRPPLTPSLLKELIRFDGVRYFWRERGAEMFNESPYGSAEKSAVVWNRNFAGKETLCRVNADGYVQACLFDRIYRAHRVIWAFHYGEWPNGQIDHINHNKSDNRIENLRVVSQAENARNRSISRNNVSGHTGVHWHKIAQKWVASIRIDGKQEVLGRFDNIEKAIDARKKAEVELGYHSNHGAEVAADHIYRSGDCPTEYVRAA